MAKNVEVNDHEIFVRKYNLLLEAPPSWAIFTDQHSMAFVARSNHPGVRETVFTFCTLLQKTALEKKEWLDQLAKDMAARRGMTATRVGEMETMDVGGRTAQSQLYEITYGRDDFFHRFVFLQENEKIHLITLWCSKENAPGDFETFRLWLANGIHFDGRQYQSNVFTQEDNKGNKMIFVGFPENFRKAITQDLNKTDKTPEKYSGIVESKS